MNFVDAQPSALDLIKLGLPPQSSSLEPLTQAQDLLRSHQPQQALIGPLKSPLQLKQIQPKERKNWGPYGLKVLIKTFDFASRILRWRAFNQLGELGKAGEEAQELIQSPFHPTSFHDELRLSIARALFEQLKDQPERPQDLIQKLKEQISQLQQATRSHLVAQALSLHASLMSLLNDEAGAQETTRLLWLKYGHTPPGQIVPSPHEASLKDWLTRGQNLFKERAYLPALEAFQHLTDKVSLPNASPQEQIDQVQALLLSAVSLMRLRIDESRTDQFLSSAEMLLKAIPPTHDEYEKLNDLKAQLLKYQSILWARQKRWTIAIQANQSLIPFLKGIQKDEAHYQVGRLLHQAGRYQEAAQAHSHLLTQNPRDPERVRWFLGWSYYRAGDCPNARKVWSPLLKKKNLLEGPQALYWSAFCLSKEGLKKQALKQLKQLFNTAPISYYGLLGRQLDAELRNQTFKWSHPLLKKQSTHLQLARAPTLQSLTRSRAWRDRTRSPLWEVLALKRSGLDEHARVLWREVCTQPTQAIKRLLGKQAQKLCERSGQFVDAYGDLWKMGAQQKAGWQISGYGEFLKKDATLRVKAYPLAFEGMTRAIAQKEELSPWWLLAHMLQESRYRPEVMSHAQAIGLMQILERTGLRIREKLNWPPTPFSGELLFKPGVALRLSAWYLKQLWLDLGHPILAMAAYNGGPMRMADHVDAYPHLIFTELIEELGAHESRNYMRKIVDHTLRYLALYGSAEEWTLWIQRLALPTHAPKPKRIVDF